MKQLRGLPVFVIALQVRRIENSVSIIILNKLTSKLKQSREHYMAKKIMTALRILGIILTLLTAG